MKPGSTANYILAATFITLALASSALAVEGDINLSSVPAPVIQVLVPANPLWTDTGIHISTGQTVTISASGTWDFAFGPVGPDGDPTYFSGAWDEFVFFDLADHGRLIAFVGPDPFQGQWGNAQFFPQTSGYISVGSGQTFKVHAGGELWLGINDDAVTRGVGDNNGQLTATIAIAGSDKTAPKIKIKAPSSVYAQNQNVIVQYTCTDANDPVVSCVGTLNNGASADTQSLGFHSFTVLASDSHANPSSNRVVYTVGPVGLAPASIAFPAQAVGTSSVAQKVKLVNNQSVPLNISAIGSSGDFAQSATTCGQKLAAHHNCSITVKFMPTATGSRVGSINVSDDSGSHSMTLIGTGK